MCPVEAVVGELPVHPAEVVHDIAAGDDENAMLAQRRQLGAEFEVVVEALVGVDAQLHDRDGRVRKGVHKHRPGAVVDAPAVEVRADPGRVDDVAHLRRQLREPGRRVLHRPLRGGNTRATPRTTADSATARTSGGTTPTGCQSRQPVVPPSSTAARERSGHRATSGARLPGITALVTLPWAPEGA